MTVHSLLRRQLASIQGSGKDDAIDIATLLRVVNASYEEYDRERRLNDRAARLMEEELTEVNQRLQQENITAIEAIFQAADQSMLILSGSGIVEGVNPAAEKLFLKSKNELIGCDTGDFIYSFADSFAELTNSQTSPHGYSFEGEYLGRNNEALTIDVSVSHFRYHHKEQFLAIIRNISEQRKREADLISAREAAIAANSAKSNFLASMSHELRTPLNAILGFAQIIRDQIMGPSAERYSDYAADIYKSGQHLLSLIDDILDLSKIDSGRLSLHLVPLDLIQMAEDTMSIVRAEAENKKIALRLEKPNLPVMIMADARSIKQVIINLLSNAVKFTPDGGSVTIRIGRTSQAFLVVQDTGIGISEEDLQHIFEPFHRGNSLVSRNYSGTGLGLAITKKLLEMHGGAIDVRSVEHQGTAVTMLMPLAASEKSGDEWELMGVHG